MKSDVQKIYYRLLYKCRGHLHLKEGLTPDYLSFLSRHHQHYRGGINGPDFLDKQNDREGYFRGRELSISPWKEDRPSQEQDDKVQKKILKPGALGRGVTLKRRISCDNEPSRPGL